MHSRQDLKSYINLKINNMKISTPAVRWLLLTFSTDIYSAYCNIDIKYRSHITSGEGFQKPDWGIYPQMEHC